MRQVTRDRVAKQRQRAAVATPAPSPASLRPRATAPKEEGQPELVRPQTETVVRPMVDESVNSVLKDSKLEPSEDLSKYAPRTVEVGIYGPIGSSRPVVVFACCDIAARQLQWVNDKGEILVEPPAVKGDPSLPIVSSDPYGGPGSHWRVAAVAWAHRASSR